MLNQIPEREEPAFPNHGVLLSDWRQRIIVAPNLLPCAFYFVGALQPSWLWPVGRICLSWEFDFVDWSKFMQIKLLRQKPFRSGPRGLLAGPWASWLSSTGRSCPAVVTGGGLSDKMQISILLPSPDY